MSDAWLGLLAFFGLLIANGFFVGAEFAVISAKRAQIEPRAEAGSKPAKLTIKAMENVSLVLATCQLGVTISGLLILLVAEPAIHEILHEPLHLLGLSESITGFVSFGITLLVVSFLHVLIGEMVPKNISFSIPERAALVLGPIVYGLAIVMKPLVFALNAIANASLRIFGIKPKNEANSAYTIEQVEDIVSHSTREGVLSDETGAISNTFEFTDKQVKDILVPLDKLVTVDLGVTPRDIEQLVAKHGFSRYIVLDENNELEGYLHLKDVIDEVRADEPVERKLLRTVKSIGGGVELEDALAQMQRDHQHLAASFDSEGRLLGLVFLEDILEELVGEVQDATRRD
jgi:CBS domain containing-hemolysin-like protein